MHKSVLLDEAIEFLNPKPKDIIVDLTTGGGGHAEKILDKIIPGGKFIGIDCDKEAIKTAQERLKNNKGSFELVCDNFKNIDKVLDRLNIKKINGALFDLGVSSFQLDDINRGFSFKGEARLDMRMDASLAISAYEVVNKTPQYQLEKIIKDYGEERYCKKIAKAIIEYRKKAPIEYTTQLREIIYSTVPWHYRKSKIDPATRTFQALRIAVNDELNSLKTALEKIESYLMSGSRVVAISFHSLEDRIVKHHFKKMKQENIYRILTKKPIIPSEAEIRENPRSRSAKLRAAEKND